MKQISTSISGKIMLLGEHAVVYGYPCIVSSIDRYLTVTAKKFSGSQDDIIVPHGINNNLVKLALTSFRNHFGKGGKFSISTDSKITGFGLGSSAAVVVAIFQSLSSIFEIPISKQHLFDLSYQTIIKLQPHASGFDIASCIWGGTLMFNGKDKSIEMLSSKELPIIVIFSGAKADTVSMVEKVARFRKNDPEETEEIFQSIHKIVSEGKILLLKNDWIGIGKLMNDNHTLLQSLGVSNNKLDKLVKLCIENGAYGAKISGAGGGDCIIAVAPSDKRKTIESGIINSGGKVLNIQVGNASGVQNLL